MKKWKYHIGLLLTALVLTLIVLEGFMAMSASFGTEKPETYQIWDTKCMVFVEDMRTGERLVADAATSKDLEMAVKRFNAFLTSDQQARYNTVDSASVVPDYRLLFAYDPITTLDANGEARVTGYENGRVMVVSRHALLANGKAWLATVIPENGRSVEELVQGIIAECRTAPAVAPAEQQRLWTMAREAFPLLEFQPGRNGKPSDSPWSTSGINGQEVP